MTHSWDFKAFAQLCRHLASFCNGLRSGAPKTRSLLIVSNFSHLIHPAGNHRCDCATCCTHSPHMCVPVARSNAQCLNNYLLRCSEAILAEQTRRTSLNQQNGDNTYNVCAQGDGDDRAEVREFSSSTDDGPGRQTTTTPLMQYLIAVAVDCVCTHARGRERVCRELSAVGWPAVN